MDSSDHRVMEYVCCDIARIARPPSNRPLLAIAELITVLTRVLRRFEESAVIDEGAVFVLSFVTDASAAVPLLARSGALPALVAVLRLHGSHDGIACKSAATMSSRCHVAPAPLSARPLLIAAPAS